ncbi:hypothetical protein Nham_2835 [Nitrobacter hamburgensis X14]|uniref:Uncharacterized protein n=1 Tax=Nitrobacter hamburgensis (strain DSM 10229 / NCIMB 13809 / X14) TaxID=323097 RepID=Q1QJJ1_NITHX|nr:hypothetical protein Nham_2835 [Nitrobacter hamburgensis X14]
MVKSRRDVAPVVPPFKEQDGVGNMIEPIRPRDDLFPYEIVNEEDRVTLKKNWTNEKEIDPRHSNHRLLPSIQGISSFRRVNQHDCERQHTSNENRDRETEGTFSRISGSSGGMASRSKCCLNPLHPKTSGWNLTLGARV